MTVKWSGNGFDADARDVMAKEGTIADLLVDPTVEIKIDKLCRKTGNLYVEYLCDGEPSGIWTSDARYWVFHYFDGCMIIVPRKRLEFLVLKAKWEGRIVKGGDFDKTRGVLIPIEWLVEIGRQKSS